MNKVVVEKTWFKDETNWQWFLTQALRGTVYEKQQIEKIDGERIEIVIDESKSKMIE